MIPEDGFDERGDDAHGLARLQLLGHDEKHVRVPDTESVDAFERRLFVAE